MERIKTFITNIHKFVQNNKRLSISLTSALIIALIMIPVVNYVNNAEEETNETASPITINYETDVVNTDGELNNLQLLHNFIDQVDNNEPALIRYVNDQNGELDVMTLDFDGEFINTNLKNTCTYEDLNVNNPCVYEDRFAWKKEDGIINYYLISGNTSEHILSVDLSIATNRDYYNTQYTIDYEQDVIIKDNGKTIQNLDSLQRFKRSTNTYAENQINIVEITDSGIVNVTTLHHDGYNIHVNNHMSSDQKNNCDSAKDSKLENNACTYNSNVLVTSGNQVIYTLLNEEHSEVILNYSLADANTNDDSEPDTTTE